MNISDIQNASPNIQQHKDGKWVSINIDPDTLFFIFEIKKALRTMGLKMTQNDIAKRLLEIGTENINLDLILQNPLALWTNEVKENIG
jgi:hypothetical protein